MNRPEMHIHKQILGYLRAVYPGALIFHPANEGNRGGIKGIKDGARNKAMGQLAGVPDIIMLSDGQFYGFEVKAPKNYPSASQKTVGALIEVNGGKWAVVRSVEDVGEAMNSREVKGAVK